MRNLLAGIISSISVFSTVLTSHAVDVVTLKNGDTLTGKLINSDQAGVYVLNFSESTTPLKIKEESIASVTMENNAPDKGLNSEKIQLTNGDFFPCKLESFDEKTVTFSSDYMGKNSIPREKVQRIYFNNMAQNILYEGPDEDLSTWKSTPKDWKLEDGVLKTKKKTQISRFIKKLPENFQFEFTVTWTGDAPRLKVYFCAESTNISKKMDNYYLDMSSLEFRITHYAKRRYKNLGYHKVDPKIYTVPKGKVSIYVDRKNKNIVIYYNGKKIKEFKDVTTPPKGSAILFHTLQRVGEGVTLSDIKVKTWNGNIIEDGSANEERLKNNDIITDTNGNPMTGKLNGITKKNGKFFLNFNIAFAKDTSSIPMTEIQHIDLQRPKEKQVSADTKRTLILNHGGQLSYNTSQILDNKIVLKHSILGDIKVDKKSVSNLEIQETK